MKKLGILISILLLVVSMIVGVTLKSKQNATTLGKEETEYTATKDGSRIANIPYDNYLSNEQVSNKYAKVDKLNENNNSDENTSAIQQVVNSLSKSGGGVIYIPKGTYKIEMLELKSNITMYIEKGAELISLNYDEYKNTDYAKHAVIYAENAENIKITGGGTINGMVYHSQMSQKPISLFTHLNHSTCIQESLKQESV